jgi:predicted small lipoprotein YifL
MAFSPNRLAWSRRTVSLGIAGLLLVVLLASLAGCGGSGPTPTPTPTAQVGVPLSVTVQAPSQPQPATTPTPGAYPEATTVVTTPYPAPTQ